jgi:hypothetical protein
MKEFGLPSDEKSLSRASLTHQGTTQFVDNVFISYRRGDSAPYAGRICDRLSAVFGSDHVFMDVEDLRPGEDFTQAIDATIARCRVVVAVIGPEWLETLRARAGQEDLVEHEIAAALRRGITLVPVLVGGAAMPREADLPPALKSLARRQAAVIRDAGFDDDINRLVRAVRGSMSPTKRIWLLLASGILVAIVGSILLLFSSRRSMTIDGAWIARMERSGGRPYTIRLRFITSGDVLSGAVEYPAGSGALQGSIDDEKLTFSTTHVPQFESEPATIRFTGEIRGREIPLIATMPDGGVATGTARRSE